jgi:hypothetical protein
LKVVFHLLTFAQDTYPHPHKTHIRHISLYIPIAMSADQYNYGVMVQDMCDDYNIPYDAFQKWLASHDNHRVAIDRYIDRCNCVSRALDLCLPNVCEAHHDSAHQDLAGVIMTALVQYNMNKKSADEYDHGAMVQDMCDEYNVPYDTFQSWLARHDKYRVAIDRYIDRCNCVSRSLDSRLPNVCEAHLDKACKDLEGAIRTALLKAA